jgi:single-stranded DNA-binding protein
MSKTEATASKVLVTDNSSEIATRNEVTLTGSVVHIFEPEGKSVVVLTLATNAGASVKSNFPKVTWHGEAARKISQELSAGINDHPRVCIKAFVQTSKRENNGETKYYQNIVGSELSFAPKLLESQLGIEAGARYVPDENAVILVGEVVHTFNFFGGKTKPKKDAEPVGTILTLKTTSGGRISFPKVSFFRDQAKAAQGMKIGDFVAVYGSVQTSKSEKADGTVSYYETVIGVDIDLFRG